MPSISVRRLYQENQQKLNLTWVAGTGGADNMIGNDEQRPTQALVGHLTSSTPTGFRCWASPRWTI